MKWECRACLLPQEPELMHVVDTVLVHEGVVLTRRQLEEVSRLLRAYLAGRFAIPLDEI